jgi:hypothetical protein
MKINKHSMWKYFSIKCSSTSEKALPCLMFPVLALLSFFNNGDQYVASME